MCQGVVEGPVKYSVSALGWRAVKVSWWSRRALQESYVRVGWEVKSNVLSKFVGVGGTDKCLESQLGGKPI